ncbi:MAG: UDP-glucose dehydrogenase family protein [Cetobacterium sp.]|uniref:UDP-glucose dehydrogenase family protein n=1 Tax=Cetobacterium sp. TaxID=2071632 RepID=UPI003F41433E
MQITIIGTGYVGLVQGVILSEFGHKVTCVDIDEKKINSLKNGILPIYELGLKELLDRNVLEGRLKFTTNKEESYKNSDVIFIAVGTPPAEDGSADLTHVSECARDIGKFIKKYTVVVNKSTVPVGTGDLVVELIESELITREKRIEFDVVSNPEFLREGKAVNDCLRPDRVVIGAETKKALEIMKKLYDVLYINKTPFVCTDRRTAEMIKYASNAFLAVKISFINELALLAEKVGANTQEIASAMGMDGRISPKFLHCGPGYGGSCFPKDTKAIVEIGKKYGEEMCVISSAIFANEKQKVKMVQKIVKQMGNLNEKTICILGLSFKPDTDDVRDAPSLDIIKGLIKNGAKIKTYCPKGMPEAKWRLENYNKSIEYCTNEEIASTGVDAVVLLTEWNQFRGLNLEKLNKRMKDNYYFDFRNVHTKNSRVRSLFKYFPVGQN